MCKAENREGVVARNVLYHTQEILRAGDAAQLIQCLTNVCKVLGLIPSPTYMCLIPVLRM